jgi:hypothetical protein
MSQNNQKYLSRRSLLHGCAALVGVAALARVVKPELAFAQRKGGGAPASSPAAGGGLKLVDPNDPTAKGLNYVVDQSKAPKNLQIKRGVTEFAGQKCGTCAFFKGVEGKIGKDDVGQCQLITNGKVKTGSWCTSWSLKPA